MCIDLIIKPIGNRYREEDEHIGLYKRTNCGALLPPFQKMNCFPLSSLGIIIPTTCWFFIILDASVDTYIFGIITYILSLSFLIAAWLTEPGVLPTVDTEETRSDGRLVKKVILNDRHFSLTQFRAKYCKELKVTIEKFDHFCPWTGNGVGIRNYHLFFFFLVFTNIHAFFVGFTSLKASAKKTEYRTLLIVLTVYCIGIICLVGFLLIYHISIINNNITTNEKLKNTYGVNSKNPHDKGCLNNWMCFFTNAFTQRKSYVINPKKYFNNINLGINRINNNNSSMHEEETDDLLGGDDDNNDDTRSNLTSAESV
tara:strand:- start:26 stop:964 length:939 start_codon:yes stop_codon:yes gene_type:complete